MIRQTTSITVPREDPDNNWETTLLYLARKHDCSGCKLKALCCPKGPFRRIPRNQHEAARDITCSFAGTKTFEQSRRERKKIEMRFAHLKRILRLSRLRLRGHETPRTSLFWPPSPNEMHSLVINFLRYPFTTVRWR